SLAGEDLQRLVLGLPAKAADCAVIAVVVESTADPEVDIVVVGVVGQQRGIIDVLDQAGAERRRGNPEDDVIGHLSYAEAGLRQAAAACVGTSRDRKEVFYSAVGRVGVRRAVGVEEEREAHFTNRPVDVDERW